MLKYNFFVIFTILRDLYWNRNNLCLRTLTELEERDKEDIKKEVESAIN